MPKTKAGTLKPVIDELKKKILGGQDSLPLKEKRVMTRRLKRLQRKACRIRKSEEASAASTRPKAEPAPAEAEKSAEASP